MVAGSMLVGTFRLARWGGAMCLAIGAAVASDVSVEIVEEAKLIASDGQAGDQFGRAVALQNGIAVVGAPRHHAPGADNAGAAYVFVDDGSSWSERAILRAPQPGADDDFGTAVAVDGDTIIVGARHDDDAGTDVGTATVFVRSGTQWDVQAVLSTSNVQANAQFGSCVLVQGDRAFVGAPLEMEDSPVKVGTAITRGAVHVFQRLGTTWSEVQRLGGISQTSNYGASMALGGDVLVVGVPRPGGTFGSFVLFRSSGTAWVQENSLLGFTFAETAGFGVRVAFDGARVLAATSGENPTLWDFTETLEVSEIQSEFTPLDNGLVESVAFVNGGIFAGVPSVGSGSIQTYSLSGNVWIAGPAISPSDGTTGQEFATSMSSSGERVLVGARFDEENGPAAGAAYIYRRRLTNLTEPWLEYQALGSGAEESDRFGSAVGLAQGRLLVGAPESSVSGFGEAGAAFVYTRPSGEWVEEGTLIAQDATPDAAFGRALDVSAERAVVGAPGDAQGAGAAYVFERIGSVWSEDAKLTSSFPAANDAMGSAVSIDGDTVAVGLPGAGAGNVLVYVRQGRWTEQARLSAFDAGPGDLEFGAAVALHGHTLAVGAPRDNNQNGVDAGAIYVFRRAGSTWSFEQKVIPADLSSADLFGSAVALKDELAVGGAPRGFTGAFGKAYVFERTNGPWTQLARLNPSGGELSDGFGASVALAGERVLIGAPLDRAEGAQTGSAYVFERDGAAWPLVQRLCVLTGENEYDRLGTSVAFDGTLAVLGAPGAYEQGAIFSLDEFSLFHSFCDDADGALATCPCGLPGNQDAGCEVPQITGGVGLDVLARAEEPLNRATIRGRGYPLSTSPSVVLLRSSSLSVFGDGVLCLRLPLVRLAATVADDGAAVHVVGHGSMAGPGTFSYQAWFRSNPAGFCTPEAFNVSSGRQITW